MKRIKNRLVLILVLSLGVSVLAGCGGSPKDDKEVTTAALPSDAATDKAKGDTQESGAAGEQTEEDAVPKDEAGLAVNDIAGEITVWARLDNETAGNTIVAQQEGDPYYEFIHKYFPNLKMNVVVNGGDLQAAIAAGSPPDIYFWEGDYSETLSRVRNEWAEPLNSYMDSDKNFVNNFIPAVMADMTVEGSVYAIPIAVMPQIISANLDAFDRANVPYPDETWTIDDFMDICSRLTDKSDSKNMRVAIARNIDDIDYIRFPSIFLAAYGVKGYKEENGKRLSNFGEDPAAIEALDKFLQIQANNYQYTLSAEDRNAMGLDATQWDIDWTSGTAAMFPGVSAWAYYADNTTHKPAFRQAFLPAFTGKDGSGGANQTYIAYSMYTGSRNKEAAWDYLSFMTSEAAQTAAYMPDPDNEGQVLYPLRMDENAYKFNYGIPPFTTEYKLSESLQACYEGMKAASESPVNVPMDAPKLLEALKSVAKGEAQLADALKKYDEYVNANESVNWEAYK